MRRQAPGQPANAVGWVIEHAGGDAGFLNHPVAVHQGRNPAQIKIHRLDRATAHDDSSVGGVVGDGVHDFARSLALRIDALRACVDQLKRRDDVVGRRQHVGHGHVFAFEPILEDERQFDLDHRHDETIARNLAAVGKNHVVEQRAEIGLVDLRRHLHRARSQPDLVANDLAPLGDLDIDPRLLDRVGVGDGDLRMVERYLADLLAAFLRLVEAARGRRDNLLSEHFQSSGGVRSGDSGRGYCFASRFRLR